MGLAASWPGERDLVAGKRFLESTGLPFTRSKRIGPVGFGGLGSVPQAPVRVAVVHEGGSRAALARAERGAAAGGRPPPRRPPRGAPRRRRQPGRPRRAGAGGAGPGARPGAGPDRLLPPGRPREGLPVLPGPTQRAEELDLLAERRAEYGRRRAAAEAAGNAALAAALVGEAWRSSPRARRELRAAPPPGAAGRPAVPADLLRPARRRRCPRTRRCAGSSPATTARWRAPNLAAAKAGGRPCPDPAQRHAFLRRRRRGAARRAPATVATATRPPSPPGRGRPTPSAYATLEKGGRQFDLDCVSCHVTGWKLPGRALRRGHHGRAPRRAVRGVPRSGQPPRRRPAWPHRARSARRPPAPAATPRSTPPGFEPASFRSRVVGPGHGDVRDVARLALTWQQGATSG